VTVRRTALLAVLLVALVAPAQALAGALVDRAVQGLQSDNVYVDAGANPKLSDADAEQLRERIAGSGAGPIYVAVVPRAIVREAGGDPTQALDQIARGINRHGTYVIVAGRTIRALSDQLDAGEAGKLATEAIGAHKSDGLGAILLDFVDRTAAARSNGGSGGGDGGGSGSGGFIVLGLIGAGGVAAFFVRRKRRRVAAAEFAEAKHDARDDLVALGDDIRALDVDVEMPTVDPQAKADYDHAVDRYTEAEQQWEAARRPQELAPVGAALEEGRWAMSSAKARMEGKEPPERRPPCFFDPRHGPSTRDVLWSPPYGEERLVPACEADALRVERGDDPEPREVLRGGQRVPYWNAGPAYGPFAGGFFGGYGGGLLPGLLIGSTLGGAWGPGVAYGGDGGQGDGGQGGGDFGGGGLGGGDFGGGGFGGGGDFGGGGGGDF
jgi:hypothetical protein